MQYYTHKSFASKVRSLTLGVGSFHWEYDHLQEVPEKLAERVIQSNGNGGNGNGK
ncbi:MAG: hypothetical protein KME55_18145 [Nostoc indistinguendum CM1-VF10]|jgi:elongation factor G|nr:hypothetical protein [Nostoc indistinguendum CM1-VF10]